MYERSHVFRSRRRFGDEFRAVDELADVLADIGEFHHSGSEVVHHKLLVIHHTLPFASSAL